MPTADSSTSLFLLGDIVLQNPKETGVIFAIVVILSIILENVFAFFRQNKSKYVRLLFAQVSEEMMIVGMIGLIFVFITQSFENLPQRWTLLFTWTQTVIFFMMVFFLVGIITTALAMKTILRRFKAFEDVLISQNVQNSNQLDMTRLNRAFVACRTIYKQQLASSGTQSALGKHAAQCRDIPFSKYLEPRIRSTVVKFTDVTWQCWLSIIFASGANSIRLFLLPGDPQKASEFSQRERVANHVSFIIIIGYIPAIIFLVSFVMLLKNFFRYQISVESRLSAAQQQQQEGGSAIDMNGLLPPTSPTTGKPVAKLRSDSGAAWLPPKHLAAQLLGELFEDPSRFLLRSNRSFTLHMVKVPCILTEFYFSIFVVGMWGEMSTELGTAQIGLIPFAILPVILIFGLLPISLLIVTVLTSLGTRLDTTEIVKIAQRSGHVGSHQKHHKHKDEDSESEEEREMHESTQGALQVPEAQSTSTRDRRNTDISRKSSSFSGTNESSTASQEEINALKARIRFLEDLCQSYGIPIAGRTIDEKGAFTEQSSLATVLASISKLQEQNSQIIESQGQLASLQRAQRVSPAMIVAGQHRTGDSDTPLNAPAGAPDEMQRQSTMNNGQAYVDAISAARRFSPGGRDDGLIVVNRQHHPSSTAAALGPIHKAASRTMQGGKGGVVL